MPLMCVVIHCYYCSTWIPCWSGIADVLDIIPDRFLYWWDAPATACRTSTMDRLFLGWDTLLLFLCSPTVVTPTTATVVNLNLIDFVVIRLSMIVFKWADSHWGAAGYCFVVHPNKMVFSFATLILPLTVIQGLFRSLLHYSCACAPILRQDQSRVMSNKLVQTKRRQPPFIEQMSLPAWELSHLIYFSSRCICTPPSLCLSSSPFKAFDTIFPIILERHLIIF